MPVPVEAGIHNGNNLNRTEEVCRPNSSTLWSDRCHSDSWHYHSIRSFPSLPKDQRSRNTMARSELGRLKA